MYGTALSESSLFVFPTKFVLKTCGTTKLLNAIPLVLEHAAAIGMKPRRCKYTRSTFLFPDEQPMGGNFDEETKVLESYFGGLGPDGGNSFVLGSKLRGVQWHVYLADDNGAGNAAKKPRQQPRSHRSLSLSRGEGRRVSDDDDVSEDSNDSAATGDDAADALSLEGSTDRRLFEPTVSLEVCMTHLDVTHAKHFFRTESFVSSRATTEESGIAALFPDMTIDDYVFEPCGYSMNGVDRAINGKEFSTIHITPEDGFSYCSVEHSNLSLSRADPEAYVRGIAARFKPGKFSLAVSTDAPPATAAEMRRVPTLPGYRRVQASHQEIDASGGAVSFYTFVRLPEENFTMAIDDVVATAKAAVAAAQIATLEENFELSPAASDDDEKPSSYDTDEDAPDRKKLRLDARCDSPHAGCVSALSAGTVAGLEMNLSLPSVNDLGAMATATATTAHAHHSVMKASPGDAKGIATLRASLPTPRPLACAQKHEDALVVKALVESHAKSLPGGGARSIDNCVLDVIESGLAQRAQERLERFLVVDLGVVTRRWHYWRATLPRVQPHYAVKCNMDTRVLATLAALGSSFDCASPTEVDAVISLGVSPDRIIYANPCKLPRHLAAVAGSGVSLTTFDSVGELEKISALAPEMKVLLRLRADDPDARCVLGNKYGAEPAEVKVLLEAAKRLGVNVNGVSFHVGSGATNPLAFREALEFARVAFDTAKELGLPPMEVLDIGGGFSGSIKADDASNDDDVTLAAVAGEVNKSLERLFPEAEGVRVISEPGRYFAEACVTLACMIFSRRIRSTEDGSLAPGEDSHQYFVSDGLYGMMNSIMYDHATVNSRLLPVATNAAALAAGNVDAVIPANVYAGDDAVVGNSRAKTYPSTVFGPTCDGLDKIHEQTAMPELTVGDWLVFPHMGAYTVSAGSNFNGFSCADVKKFYVCSPSDADPEPVVR